MTRISICCFFVLLCFCPVTFAQTTPEGYYQLGVRQLEANDNPAAIASFSECLKLNGKYVQCLIGRARAYRSMAAKDLSQYVKSNADLTSAISLDANNKDARYLRASNWADIKLGNMAMLDLNKLREIDPGNPRNEALENKLATSLPAAVGADFDLMKLVGEWEGERIHTNDPKYNETLKFTVVASSNNSVKVVYGTQTKYEFPIKYESPGKVEFYYGTTTHSGNIRSDSLMGGTGKGAVSGWHGTWYLRKKRNSATASTPTTTPKPVDNNEWIRLNSAGALKLKNNDIAGAISDFTKCLEIKKAGGCYSGRAKAYIAQKQYDLAVKDAIAAKDINPNVGESWSLLATINGLTGEVNTALSNMAEAIRWDPTNPYFYLQRAQLRCSLPDIKLLATSDEEKAKQLGAVVEKPCGSATTQVTSSQPADKKKATELYQAGLVSKVMRDLIGAERSFTQALQYAPNDPEILLQRANVRYAQRKYDDAFLDFNNSIRINDKDTRAWHWRGLLYDAMGKQDLAVSDYSRAIQLDPTKAAFFADRASVYSDLGKIELAIADIDQALKLDPKNQVALDVKKRIGPYVPASAPNSSETVLFFDGFDDNKHNWPVGTSDYVDGIIANGRQTIDLRTDVYHRTMLGAAIAPQIDQTKDFMIETSITFLSGNEYYPFGINWGMKDLNQNSFEFNIARGNFMHAKIVAGQYINIFTWTAHAAIRTGAGATNKLAIRKRGTKLELSVNDTLVATKDYEAYTAPASIGFNIGFKKKIEIDYLKVVQYK